MLDQSIFVPNPNSHRGKVCCKFCGRSGYPTNGYGWQKACLRGHLPCPRCGRLLSVKLDGSARTHTRCPV